MVVASRNGCCLCERAGTGIEIHHINEDPSDHAFDNLAPLCPNHHSEIDKQGGRTRNWTPASIRALRDQWYERIKIEREPIRPVRATAGELTLDAMVDALTVFDIRKASMASTQANTWAERVALLRPLTPLFDRFPRYGPAVREALISAAFDMCDEMRGGFPQDAARLASRLTRNALPIYSLVGPRAEPITEADRSLFRQGGNVGWALVYDGVKYLRDIHIVGAGCDILWALLRCAAVNPAEKKLRKEISGYYRSAISNAKAAKFDEAEQWLTFSMGDALATRGKRGPPMPSAISRKLLEDSPNSTD